MSFTTKLLDILSINATAAKEYIDKIIETKQDKIVFDAAPKSGSSNLVTSDGIRRAIDSATPRVDLSNYPTKNGAGATGTWPISISGAATKASQDSNGRVIADTYATKTDLDAVSKKASIQADWNSTDSSSIAFIKNIPNSIKSINNSSNFRIKNFYKVDNSGCPTYRIIQELTNYHPTNRPSNWGTYGFSVIALCDIRGGNGQRLEPAFMYASLGYEYNMLKSTSSVDFPVVLHNIESDKYYVAIRTSGSYKTVTLMGDFCYPDIELGEEILAQDGNGTPPSGWELTYRPKDMLSMEQLQAGRANDALKLAWTRLIKLTGDMTGDIYFDGSKDITVNTTVNESKHAVNADSATTANNVVGMYLGSSGDGGKRGPDFFGKKRAGCLMSNQPVNGHDEYKNWLYMDNYDGSDVGGATAIGISRTETRAYIMSSNADRKQWDRSAELLSSANYNQFAPTKTGTGASGTWGISITGNASTATKLQTPRTLSLTGKASGSTTFDGSANAAINVTSVNADTASKLSTARKINITGNATGAATFDGTSDVSINVSVSQATNADKATADANGNELANAQRYMHVYDLPNNTDFNNVKTTGIYTCTQDNYTNRPAASWGVLRVYWFSDNVKQEYVPDNRYEVYERYFTGGEWNAWSKVNAANADTAAACSGNSATATKLATARAISLTGNASGSATFDGSGNISINTTVSQASVADVVHKAIQPRGVYGDKKYIFYGTLTIPQNGDFFKLEVLGGYGHNSDVGQSKEGTLYFRTGNNNPAHYAAYSEYHRNGAGGLEFFIVKDSGTKYRIYSNLTSFTGTMQVIPYIGQNSSFDLALNTVSALPNDAVEVEQQQLIYASTVNNYAPTKTGVGASGTWGINISGNANSATKLANNGNRNDIANGAKALSGLSVYQCYQNTGYPQQYGNVVSIGGTGDNELFLGWADDSRLLYRAKRDNESNWKSWRAIAFTDEINNYAPTKTGSGATGTWGISISGNAATATTALNIPTSDVGGNIWIA